MKKCLPMCICTGIKRFLEGASSLFCNIFEHVCMISKENAAVSHKSNYM